MRSGRRSEPREPRAIACAVAFRSVRGRWGRQSGRRRSNVTIRVRPCAGRPCSGRARRIDRAPALLASVLTTSRGLLTLAHATVTAEGLARHWRSPPAWRWSGGGAVGRVLVSRWPTPGSTSWHCSGDRTDAVRAVGATTWSIMRVRHAAVVLESTSGRGAAAVFDQSAPRRMTRVSDCWRRAGIL